MITPGVNVPNNTEDDAFKKTIDVNRQTKPTYLG
jgi:hypothetical protein